MTLLIRETEGRVMHKKHTTNKDEDEFLPKDFHVVRCSSNRTIELMRRLNFAKARSWTPIHVMRKRLHGKRNPVKVQAPTTPSFVFINSSHIEIAVNVRDQGRCPPFTKMMVNGYPATIFDMELDGLRWYEAHNYADAKQTDFFEKGQMCLIKVGPMKGKHVEVEGRHYSNNIVVEQDSGWKLSLPPSMLSLCDGIL